MLKCFLKKILKYKYTPIILLTIVLIIIHTQVNLFADDVWFKNILDKQSLSSYLISRYNTWTSRLIIESCLVTIVSFPFWVWKILDIIVIDALYIAISKLLNKDNKMYINWIIVALIFLYSFSDMGTAGFAATTLNYIWPLSFGLVSLICFKKIYNNEHISCVEYILYFVCLIYAVNEEQMCIILVGTSVLFSIYLLIKKDKRAVVPLIFTCICVASLVFIFTVPGNEVRKAQEIATWFPGFNMLTFSDKIMISITSTIAEYIFSTNLIFMAISFLLIILITIKYKNIFYTLISAVPILVYSLINVSNITGNMKIKVINLYDFVHVTNINYDKIQSYIPFIICVFIIICLGISIYLVFENTKNTFICLFIFIIGLLSRMAMVFSPTLYVSDRRTFIFLDFSFVIIMLYIIVNLSKVIKEYNKEIVKYFCIICAFLLIVKVVFLKTYF